MLLSELLARESIRDLVARYNSNGDSGRFDQVLSLFTMDAVMDVDGREYRGLDQIRSVFMNTKALVRGGSQPGYVRHYVATHQIDLIDDTHATGRAYYAVISPVGLDHWGRYVDEYCAVDGSWRFTRRRVTVDGAVPGSIIAEPTATGSTDSPN